jgi:hypothetical protein
VDPRAGLDDMEKRKFYTLPGLEFRPPNPARSQSLYRLSYPGSFLVEGTNKKITEQIGLEVTTSVCIWWCWVQIPAVTPAVLIEEFVVLLSPRQVPV